MTDERSQPPRKQTLWAQVGWAILILFGTMISLAGLASLALYVTCMGSSW